MDRIGSGYREQTPNGVHFFYYCDAPSNQKLAQDADRKTLIETKGEGGYAVCAPSFGQVHPSGEPYVLLSGSFETIARITDEERKELHHLAATFDHTPEEPERK